MNKKNRAGLEYDKIGPDITKSFAENGVVCMRGVIASSDIEILRECIEVAIKNRNPKYNKPGATYIVDGHLWTKYKGFKRFTFDSNIAELAAMVMGSHQVRVYDDAMFVKEPSAPEPTPWHQDLPYFRLNGPNNCSVWIPLDPANEASGAMSYTLGSYRWGKMFEPVNFAEGTSHAESEFDGPPPDVDAEPDRYATATFDVRPGDVVFHHLLTLHKAGPNSSKGTRRRVHTIRFAGISPRGLRGNSRCLNLKASQRMARRWKARNFLCFGQNRRAINGRSGNKRG